jgi:hypothetical protein
MFRPIASSATRYDLRHLGQATTWLTSFSGKWRHLYFGCDGPAIQAAEVRDVLAAGSFSPSSTADQPINRKEHREYRGYVRAAADAGEYRRNSSFRYMRTWAGAISGSDIPDVTDLPV